MVADCAYKVEPQVLAGGERTLPANDGGPVYLIRKDAIEAAPPGGEVPCRAFALAPEMNHYYASWDDRDGVTVLWPAVPRHRFADELERVGELPDELAATAREVARELDEGVPLDG